MLRIISQILTFIFLVSTSCAEVYKSDGTTWTEVTNFHNLTGSWMASNVFKNTGTGWESIIGLPPSTGFSVKAHDGAYMDASHLDALDLTNNFTIDTVVQVDASDTVEPYRSIVVQAWKYWLTVDSNSHFQANVKIGDVAYDIDDPYSGAYPSGTYFVTMCKDSSGLRLYVNGDLVAEDTSITGDVDVGSGTFTIGNGYDFTWTIDETRVLNIARCTGATCSTPTDNYPVDGNTIVLYHFDDGAGSTAFTDSGPHNYTLSQHGVYDRELPEFWKETTPPPVEELKAFPGAEGYGTDTRHAYALYEQSNNPSDLPQIIHVTTTDSMGTGSLREAINVQGPSIIVFDTGGVIDSGNSKMNLESSYTYLAAQTAPGDGIVIKNSPLEIQRVHDVLVRGLRVRTSDATGLTVVPDVQHGISVRGKTETGEDEAYRIVVDHCSCSWSLDVTASIYNASWDEFGIHDVTYSRNIFGEPLDASIHPDSQPRNDDNSHPHSTAINLASVKNISFHHNYTAHSGYRNPKVQSSQNVDYVNNIIYDMGRERYTILDKNAYPSANMYLNINKLGTRRLGPDMTADTADDEDYKVHWDHSSYDLLWVSPYVIYNPGQINLDTPETLYFDGDWDTEVGYNLLDRVIQSPTRLTDPPRITETPLDELEDNIFNDVGATAPHVDATDQRYFDEYYGNGEANNPWGSIKNCIDQDVGNPDCNDFWEYVPGGYPTYASGTKPTDSDNDDMPDDWEISEFGSITVTNDPHGDEDGDGYHNIEEYLNSFFPNPLP